MGTPRKIDVILLNIKISQPKLVNMCRYKLATQSKNIAKSFRGCYFFDSHCTCMTVQGYLTTHECGVDMFAIACLCVCLYVRNALSFESLM